MPGAPHKKGPRSSGPLLFVLPALAVRACSVDKLSTAEVAGTETQIAFFSMICDPKTGLAPYSKHVLITLMK